jgi:hypothetical protein
MSILRVKPGRNDPCPCGSGNKFKRCCLGIRDVQWQPAPAQTIADEIAEAATEHSFSSLEELNEFAAQQMQHKNRRSLDEFCGLSPEQMTHFLYAPFTSEKTVHYATDIEPTAEIRIMGIFIPLVEAIGESGLKATAKGNLPLKFCKKMAQQLKDGHDGSRPLRIGGIRSEHDLEELHRTRLVAELAGLIRKYRGKFVLTQKCKQLLAKPGTDCLYMELFKAYTTKFNWGYSDGYADAEIMQLSFLYTLFLLTSFGEVVRPQQFYEDKFLAAFPMALETFPETSYSTVEDDARRCYFLRALERFAVFFGLAELTTESKELFQYNYAIRKSALLNRFITFKT